MDWFVEGWMPGDKSGLGLYKDRQVVEVSRGERPGPR